MNKEGRNYKKICITNHGDTEEEEDEVEEETEALPLLLYMPISRNAKSFRRD